MKLFYAFLIGLFVCFLHGSGFSADSSQTANNPSDNVTGEGAFFYPHNTPPKNAGNSKSDSDVDNRDYDSKDEDTTDIDDSNVDIDNRVLPNVPVKKPSM